MTEGSISKSLLAFFFPILFGTFFQQLYNTIDAMIVGHYEGKAALAAVGGGTGFYINLMVGFLVGLTNGAGVLVSQFYGSKNKRNISVCVHTSIAISLAGGIILTVIGLLSTEQMMIITKTPEDVLPEAVRYLNIYFCGMIPMFIYNMGAGIIRGSGDSQTPLIILIIGCGTNILLDLLFVALFRMGVAGVAWATVICQAESAIIVLVILMKSQKEFKFHPLKITLNPPMLRQILHLGMPGGIQSSLYTVSNLIIQTKINSFGTDTAAAWSAFGKIDGVFWMMINTFGIALATFTGQNYGAGKNDRVKKGMWITLGISAALTILMTIILVPAGNYVYLLFTDEEPVIEKGMEILRFIAPAWITYISIEILSGVMRGQGKSLSPMLTTFFGICGLRMIWLFTVVPCHETMLTVFACYPASWIVTSIVFWCLYFFSWKKTELQPA